MSREKLTKKFAKLTVADLSFCQTKALAVELSAGHDPYDWTFSPKVAGMVVTYAKNFVSGNGFGPLSESYTEFKDSELERVHKLLIEARHKVYAHRDKIAAQQFEPSDESDMEPYAVKLKVSDNCTGFTAIPAVPDLHPEEIPNVITLCAFQSERIKEEVKLLFPKLTQGRTYKRGGIYTVGVDFP